MNEPAQHEWNEKNDSINNTAYTQTSNTTFWLVRFTHKKKTQKRREKKITTTTIRSLRADAVRRVFLCECALVTTITAASSKQQQQCQYRKMLKISMLLSLSLFRFYLDCTMEGILVHRAYVLVLERVGNRLRLVVDDGKKTRLYWRWLWLCSI